MKAKFIFVTGGVYSSLGKGITASSIGCLLKEYGFKVTHQKLDPYLNVDSRNICPYQHGENFITDDGAIGDLDLGNYERFSRSNLTHFSTVTSGKIYWEVLNAERNKKYAGKTIQVVPHITDEVVQKLNGIAEHTKAEFVIVEIGGTVGDIESNPFLEAIARFALCYGYENIIFAHCCPLISIATVHGELKTKPTQHSVKNLRGMGINPNFLFLRSSVEVDEETKIKLALSCSIPLDHIFICNDVKSIYYLPMKLNEQEVVQKFIKYFKVDKKLSQKKEWQKFVNKIDAQKKCEIKVGIISQYVELHDAYLSLIESLDLASYETGCKVNIEYVQSKDINSKNVAEKLKNLNGIVLGNSEYYEHLKGEKTTIEYCIKNKLPILGIDSGFDSAIEYLIPKQTKKHLFVQNELRVGGDDSIIDEKSMFYDIYKSKLIHQRHYNKQHLDPKHFIDIKNKNFELGCFKKGDKSFVDGINLKKELHPFAVFVNYRPEFISKPNDVDPLLISFLNSCIK